MTGNTGCDPPDLDDRIASLDEDLRLWRKYDSTGWHDDPEYAAAARELASLRRQAARRDRRAQEREAELP